MFTSDKIHWENTYKTISLKRHFIEYKKIKNKKMYLIIPYIYCTTSLFNQGKKKTYFMIATCVIGVQSYIINIQAVK
jgi:hypothetical protein